MSTVQQHTWELRLVWIGVAHIVAMVVIALMLPPSDKDNNDDQPSSGW